MARIIFLGLGCIVLLLGLLGMLAGLISDEFAAERTRVIAGGGFFAAAGAILIFFSGFVSTRISAIRTTFGCRGSLIALFPLPVVGTLLFDAKADSSDRDSILLACAFVFGVGVIVLVLSTFVRVQTPKASYGKPTKDRSAADTITPTDRNDLAFLAMAQGSTVNGSTLPSGLKVPTAPPGKCWQIRGNAIHMVPENHVA